MTLERTDVQCCPICGDARSHVLYDSLGDRVFGVADGRWTLKACASCGTARLDPRPADEEIAGLYACYYTHDAPAPNLSPSGTRARLARALRNGYLNGALGYRLRPALRAGLPAGRLIAPLAAIAERPVRSLPLPDAQDRRPRLLDVGCGSGVFVAEAAASGWDAQGIDLDAAAVAAARAAGLSVVVEDIADRARREPWSYDAVTMSHVLEHVPDPVGFLRHAHALLRPGGRLWVATPNLDADGHRLYGRHWLGLDPPRHLALFTAPALRRALGTAGFGDVRLVRPTPSAMTMFRISEAVRSGIVPANAHPAAATLRLRLSAVRAEMRAQRDRSTAEELVVLASALPRSGP